jgi:hypothetical protein
MAIDQFALPLGLNQRTACFTEGGLGSYWYRTRLQWSLQPKIMLLGPPTVKYVAGWKMTSMTQSELDGIEKLAAQVSMLYSSLEHAGRTALVILYESDASLLAELVKTFGSEDRAAHWLISRKISFGGRSALDLLASGRREQVLQVLLQIDEGFFA